MQFCSQASKLIRGGIFPHGFWASSGAQNPWEKDLRNPLAMIIFLKRLYFKLRGKTPADMPMVDYWKRKESVNAKVTRGVNGETIMHMEGESQPFPGYPRGYLLFGKLSKLKHEIKNQIFNFAWYQMEKGVSESSLLAELKGPIFNAIFDLSEETRYDWVPTSKLNPAVKEIYRAWEKVSPSRRSLRLRNILCFILQEDDAYRFRVQWIVSYFSWWLKMKDPVKMLYESLVWLENAEVIDDMKERIRLLRRVLMLFLRDPAIRQKFTEFVREVDWKKVQLTKADKYHFRGKYFKVDLDKFEY